MEGILPVDKEKGKSSFHLVSLLRKKTSIRTIGHAGTLDPFAEGVMVMLIGKKFTRLSNAFLTQDKGYEATLFLGKATDTFDLLGQETFTSSHVPNLADVEKAIASFQGDILQIPPMFSAKKQGGKRLYALARQGIVVPRPPVPVTVDIQLISYEYPYLKLSIQCSKGTYIRSLADDLGKFLATYAHLTSLTRTRSGRFTLADCIKQSALFETPLERYLQSTP